MSIQYNKYTHSRNKLQRCYHCAVRFALHCLASHCTNRTLSYQIHIYNATMERVFRPTFAIITFMFLFLKKENKYGTVSPHCAVIVAFEVPFCIHDSNVFSMVVSNCITVVKMTPNTHRNKCVQYFRIDFIIAVRWKWFEQIKTLFI